MKFLSSRLAMVPPGSAVGCAHRARHRRLPASRRRPTGRSDSFLDLLYLTLQLVTLQFDGSDENLNWRLQIARFVAPIMAAGTVLADGVADLRRSVPPLPAAVPRDHVVICGLGDVGTRLALASRGAGDNVVAIEPDANVTGVVVHEGCRHHGVAHRRHDGPEMFRVATHRSRHARGRSGLWQRRHQRAASRWPQPRGRWAPAPARRCGARCTSPMPSSPTCCVRADLDAHGQCADGVLQHPRACRPHAHRRASTARRTTGRPTLWCSVSGNSAAASSSPSGQLWAQLEPDTPLPITMVDRGGEWPVGGVAVAASSAR